MAALATAGLVGLAGLTGCADPASEPANAAVEQNAPCAAGDTSRCAMHKGALRPFVCVKGGWAPYPACGVNERCKMVPDWGAACVADANTGAAGCGFGSTAALAGDPCDDGNYCTIDSCSADGCVHKPQLKSAPCSDQSVCTSFETCVPMKGACGGGSLLVCNDDKPCTLDSCDAVKGCQNTAISGCKLCIPADPSTDSAAAITWQVVDIRHLFGKDACDLDGDGVGDNRLGVAMAKFGSFYGMGAVISATNLTFATRRASALAVVGDVLRWSPASAATPGGGAIAGTLSSLHKRPPGCAAPFAADAWPPTSPPTDCAVKVTTESYQDTAGPAPCPVRIVMAASLATNAAGQARLVAQLSSSAGPKLPAGWLCAAGSPWWVRLDVGTMEVTAVDAQDLKKAVRIRICGTFRRPIAEPSFVDAFEACSESIFSPSSVRYMTTAFIKPDVDRDGDGSLESVSVAYELRAVRVNFGGAQ